jgi:hypothetical protein
MHSLNHCSCGKAINITYSECVSVPLVIRHVMGMRRVILFYVAFLEQVMVTPVQALKLCTGRTAYRGSRGIGLLFLGHGIRRGEGSASRPGHTLHPGKTRYLLYRRLGGPQGRFGQVRKISYPTGFDPRTVRPVAHSLYRLSYSGIQCVC